MNTCREVGKKAAIFLDRDGVLNDSVVETGSPSRPPFSPAELSIRDDAVTSLAALRTAGYVLIVVTNQPDIGRGSVARAAVDAVNQQLLDRLGLDALYMCSHDGIEACTCRKPRPGLLLEAASEHDVNLDRSWMIGDRWVDVAAGQAAGVRAVLLEHDRSWEPTTSETPPDDLLPDGRFPTLSDCVAYILDRSSSV